MCSRNLLDVECIRLSHFLIEYLASLISLPSSLLRTGHELKIAKCRLAQTYPNI
jgi:hypothetical protein